MRWRVFRTLLFKIGAGLVRFNAAVNFGNVTAVCNSQPTTQLKEGGLVLDVTDCTSADLALDFSGSSSPGVRARTACRGRTSRSRRTVADLAFLEKACRRPDWIGLISSATCETTTVVDEWAYDNL